MIDPKGIIGPLILDLPRFILNEFDTEYDETPAEHIRNVIKLISRRFAYPAEDIAKAFVMETFLANIWCIEDGVEPDTEQVEIAERVFAEFGGVSA